MKIDALSFTQTVLQYRRSLSIKKINNVKVDIKNGTIKLFDKQTYYIYMMKTNTLKQQLLKLSLTLLLLYISVGNTYANEIHDLYSGEYILVSKINGMCLMLQADDTNEDGDLSLENCLIEGAAEKRFWQYDIYSRTLKNMYNNKCLKVIDKDESTTGEFEISIMSCDITSNTKDWSTSWIYIEKLREFFTVTPSGDKVCLFQGEKENLGKVTASECLNASNFRNRNQKWEIRSKDIDVFDTNPEVFDIIPEEEDVDEEEWKSGYYIIRNIFSNECIASKISPTSQFGVKPQLVDNCKSLLNIEIRDDLIWYYDEVDQTVKNLYNGKCLRTTNDRYSDIHLGSCDPSSDSQFTHNFLKTIRPKNYNYLCITPDSEYNNSLNLSGCNQNVYLQKWETEKLSEIVDSINSHIDEISLMDQDSQIDIAQYKNKLLVNRAKLLNYEYTINRDVPLYLENNTYLGVNTVPDIDEFLVDKGGWLSEYERRYGDYTPDKYYVKKFIDYITTSAKKYARLSKESENINAVSARSLVVSVYKNIQESKDDGNSNSGENIAPKSAAYASFYQEDDQKEMIDSGNGSSEEVGSGIDKVDLEDEVGRGDEIASGGSLELKRVQNKLNRVSKSILFYEGVENRVDLKKVKIKNRLEAAKNIKSRLEGMNVKSDSVKNRINKLALKIKRLNRKLLARNLQSERIFAKLKRKNVKASNFNKRIETLKPTIVKRSIGEEPVGKKSLVDRVINSAYRSLLTAHRLSEADLSLSKLLDDVNSFTDNGHFLGQIDLSDTRIYNHNEWNKIAYNSGLNNNTTDWVHEIYIRSFGIDDGGFRNMRSGSIIENDIIQWGSDSGDISQEYSLMKDGLRPVELATFVTALEMIDQWFGAPAAIDFYTKNSQNNIKLYKASLAVIHAYKNSIFIPSSEMGLSPFFRVAKLTEYFLDEYDRLDSYDYQWDKEREVCNSAQNGYEYIVNCLHQTKAVETNIRAMIDKNQISTIFSESKSKSAIAKLFDLFGMLFFIDMAYSSFIDITLTLEDSLAFNVEESTTADFLTVATEDDLLATEVGELESIGVCSVGGK